ncbi:MAG TPA: OmpH family outer membrane protein [Chitinophagales bacterium]|nr:OmpH family outer membrane protein [Chitinophagales bacterium]
MKLLCSLSVALLLCAALSLQAQSNKLGHINSTELLQAMPDIKHADSTLQTYQKQLEDQNQAMLAEYQTKSADYQKLVNDATIPDAVKEVKEKELQDLQSRIQQFQQTAQDKFQSKKEELYSPILKKAEDAIKQVAKENNYSYVFDTSAGAVIYFPPEADDLMPLVKKKLGLK